MAHKGLVGEDRRETHSDKKLYTNRVKCQPASEGEGKVLTLLTVMLRCQLPVSPGLVITTATTLMPSRAWYDSLYI